MLLSVELSCSSQCTSLRYISCQSCHVRQSCICMAICEKFCWYWLCVTSVSISRR